MTGLSFGEYIDFVLDINSEPLSLEFILEHHEKSAANIVKSVEPSGAKILSLFRDYPIFAK
jgi:hypothetical protein